MGEEKKNLLDRAIDALTTRDEKEAAEKARAEAQAAHKEAAALRAKLDAERAATARAAVNKAAAERSAAAARAAAPRKGVVTTRSLRVRSDHSTSSQVVAGLVDGNEVQILGTWSDGKNTWAQLENGWAAMEYDGETYIKFV